MRRAVVACLCTLTTIACGSPHQNEGGSAYAVRDSAGVRIVTYAGALPKTPVITFAKTPTYRYGEASGEHTFQLILTGALEPDGSAVVVDWGSQEALVLSPSGSLASVLVHRGQGPGEAEKISSVHALGQDSILVDDHGNGRFMLFEKGEVARSVNIPGYLLPSMNALQVLDADSAGSLLLWTFGGSTERPWFPGRLLRFDLDTREADTVGAYDMFPVLPHGSPMNPFGYRGELAGSAGRVVYGRNDKARLIWLTSGGTLVQVLRWTPTPTYPDEKDLETYHGLLRSELAREYQGMPQSQLDELYRRQTENEQLMPDRAWPFFYDLIGDGQGGVWMGEDYIRQDPDGPRSFDVIAPDGTFVGTARMPDHFRLLAVRGHRALGVLRDEMDVESVAAFSFTVSREAP